MSLKDKILEYIRAEYPRIVHKGEIGRKAILEWNYENENAGRRCRELENEGLIEKVPHPKREAQYRAKYTTETILEPRTIQINGQSIPIFAEKKQTREKAGKLF